MEAPFKEGDVVHKDDLLFRIDPRTYQATLNQTEANLKQAVADRNLQERNTARARKLIEGRSIAQEDYDTTLATYEKSKATVGSFEAARDMAKLYLEFTQVTAPLTGRISRRFVDPGNLVVADNTMLTTLVDDGQLYAYFDVDERTYLDLLESATPGQSSWFVGLQFPVLMRLANEEQFSRSGTVNFVDNRVNASTGTIRMRGVFDNRNGFLKAGLFVRIRLPIGRPYQANLIPDEALLSDQGKKYVYVVDDNNEVVYRPVTPGQEIQTLRVIKTGLSKGERVIVSGMQRVRAKSKVEVKVQPPHKPPESTLGQLLSAFQHAEHAKQEDKEKGNQPDKEKGRQGDKETKKQGSSPAQPGG
jgi:multidrug efflux system membrane fusion protein